MVYGVKNTSANNSFILKTKTGDFSLIPLRIGYYGNNVSRFKISAGKFSYTVIINADM